MRVFRTTYRDKDGQKKRAKKWYIEFRDHLQIIRRVPAFEDKRQSEALGRQVQRLVNSRIAGEQPDANLTRWLECVPNKLRTNLVRINLIEPQRGAAGKPLSQHLEDFKQSLLAKGNSAGHVTKTIARIEKVFNGCKFKTWTDMSASRIQHFLSVMRNGEGGIGAQTFNYYLKSVKQFCKWMVQDRRAGESPVEHLRSINVRTDRQHDRRALEPDEIRCLLENTKKGPFRYKMTGLERSMLYRLAIETGLRANELRNLTVSSFDLDNCTVTVQAAYSKHRQQDVLPLRPDTAQELRGFLKGKLPQAHAFNVPNRTADMIRADLEDADIPYVDDSGRYADFHSLRHTTGSLHAASGTHPKVAQALMRHSTVELTLGRYSHLYRGQETEAIAGLPDLSLPSKLKQKAAKTGTDNQDFSPETTRKNLAQNLALSCGKGRISTDMDGQKAGKIAKVKKGTKAALEANKSALTVTGRDGTRTHTPRGAGDFKSPASANSATRPKYTE